MKANVIVFEVATLILFAAFYQGAKMAMGRSRNRGFLGGALVLSLVVQSLAVGLGAKNFYWYSINNYYQTYPLGGYIIWVGVVPLAAALLWYMVSATAYLAATALFPRRNLWVRSSAAGGYAVLFYALLEPVAVTNHWWTWNARTFYVIDVPLIALFAVFGGAFLLSVVFDLTLVSGADPSWLKKVEDATVRRWPLKSKKLTRNLSWPQQLVMFYFRLAAALVVFAVYMAPLVVVFWAVANRGHVKPGW